MRTNLFVYLFVIPFVFSCAKSKKEIKKDASITNVWLDQQVDLTHLQNSRDSLNMVNNGNVVGYWIWETIKKDNTLIFRDISVLTDQVEEEFEMKINRKNLFTQSIKMNTATSTINLDVEISRKSVHHLSGNFEISGAITKSKEIDTVYNRPIIERAEVFALMPALDLKKGLEMTIDVFFMNTTKIMPMTLTVTEDDAIVTVPFGILNCFELTFTGGEPSNVIYISKEFPRRIVKVDVIGDSLSMELVSNNR